LLRFGCIGGDWVKAGRHEDPAAAIVVIGPFIPIVVAKNSGVQSGISYFRRCLARLSDPCNGFLQFWRRQYSLNVNHSQKQNIENL
jgi:hypothetical protein